jgi:hypothetical protein
LVTQAGAARAVRYASARTAEITLRRDIYG